MPQGSSDCLAIANGMGSSALRESQDKPPLDSPRSEQLRRLGRGDLSAEMLQRLLQIIHAQRFLENRYGAEFEDVVHDLAVRIARNDDDRRVGMLLLQNRIDLIAGNIRKLEIEKAQIEALLVERG